MNQIKVNMNDMRIKKVLVLDDDGGRKEVDPTQFNIVNGKDIAVITFATLDESVKGWYMNVDLTYSSNNSDLISEISDYISHFGSETLGYINDGGNESNSHTTHFAVLNNYTHSGYPVDHFSVYNTLLADKGINYDGGNGNLELTFEVNECNFRSILDNNPYGFSVNYT